ncbi:hypothetical protein GCM10022251_69070 [Phytohabitans flavus]|uniref:Uncharacterized protein n=1 Tax=Phytohabitans flavus TaxID=1076124 RepID=A0A6F8XUQ1_9ACTN|nr:hypothetical protein [Phytohabitans flavus]BCB77556.1 hypothetical protein Pflav_039660 [Phytohabitans flavus]
MAKKVQRGAQEDMAGAPMSPAEAETLRPPPSERETDQRRQAARETDQRRQAVRDQRQDEGREPPGPVRVDEQTEELM